MTALIDQEDIWSLAHLMDSYLSVLKEKALHLLHDGCTVPLGCNSGSWVLRIQIGFSGCSVWTSASAHVLHLPSITVQGFHTYLGISDPWILGLGSAGTGCEDVSK